MNNFEFADKCKAVAAMNTRYAIGGWGQPATDSNKKWFINNYAGNREMKEDGDGNILDRKQIIMDTPSNFFFMDCVCGVKSILDGFVGDLTKTYGGATYGKPCPDYTISRLLSECTGVSTDMSSIEVGEFVVFKDKSHCGVYVGDGLVMESTYRWNDGVQLIDMKRPERIGLWYYHGKLTKYVTYVSARPNTYLADTKKLKDAADLKLLIGTNTNSSYVLNIQTVLKRLNFYTGDLDGICGKKTRAAILNFQIANGLTQTSDVNLETINALIKK